MMLIQIPAKMSENSEDTSSLVSEESFTLFGEEFQMKSKKSE